MMRPQPSRWLVGAGYGLAALLVVWPLVDITTSVWPLRFGDVNWRYGAAGLFAAYVHTPMLGLGLATGLAWAGGNRSALRGLAVLQILAAVLLLGVAGLFPLDMLQVRAARPEEMRAAVLAGAIIAEGKHATAAMVLVIMAVGCFGSARRLGAGQDRGASQDGPGILVGGGR